MGVEHKPETMSMEAWNKAGLKAMSLIELHLSDEVTYNVMEETTARGTWEKLENLYMGKTLSNKIFLKDDLFNFRMEDGDDIMEYLNVFNCCITDLLRVKVKFEEEGCSFHMCANRFWFDTYEKKDRGEVRMGNNVACKVIGIGTVKVKMYDDIICTFGNVRHIPALKKNLISLGTLDASGLTYSSSGGKIKICKGLMVIMQGEKLPNNLYNLLRDTVSGEVVVSTTFKEDSMTNSGEDSTHLWYLRLGHMSERAMEELHKRKLLKNMETCKLDFCKYCVLGKQCKVSFKLAKKENRTKGILDYIHSYVYFMRNKSEVFEKFKEWKAEVENQTGRKINPNLNVQAEKFFGKLIEKEGDPETQDPVVYDKGVSYMFIQHNNVFLMTASRQNCNAASLLSFLHRVVDVLKHYFEELEEESLRDNFVVVYELLDEMMDYGYPQYTEARILSEFIKTDAYRMEVTQRPPMAVTNAVSWRSEGIRYKKNEVFLDVVESVNILVNSNGQIIRSDVVGALKMRTYLSGMPECKLGLNDRVLLEAQGRATKGKAIDLEDIKFHQCVRLARFENDRTISFIPPDGAFDLMNYRLTTQVKPLIWVEAQIERHSKSRIEIMVKAKSQFKERSTATSVEIEIPIPADAINPIVRTSMGSAAYAPEKDALIWKIKSFPGGKEYLSRAEFGLPSVPSEDSMPDKKAPIRVKFEIPYFTISGIQVRYLKIIEKSGYDASPWVRSITMAGEYELRLF
ncbi:LOW QUALITY PROTEIN: AP-1 complex subunit mu-2-like [Asparagus officinalis]|uniref:LOW QUALITY PROTEIN: AP-1 complex subunit mu-2-like n=1 Tax=Asparagus officinalis TaxID=4686 RepID=UPI00098E831C|nr:LOW QUALITY PROTEIN: AP-1 complex subunit mu-2-like [Asparagus officinalis]